MPASLPKIMARVYFFLPARWVDNHVITLALTFSYSHTLTLSYSHILILSSSSASLDYYSEAIFVADNLECVVPG